MVVDAETVLDRRRLKRRLTAWRIAAALLGLILLGALLLNDQQVAGQAGILPHVARVSVSGIIMDDRKMHELLDRIGKADQVKAVIIEIDSPGGTTTGGEALFDSIRRLAQKKPVVATCGTLATSAAYIAALATDRIFVYGNTITGSVGVLFQWADVSELLDKIGVKVEDVRSGPLKAVPDPFHPADEKARAVTAEMVQEAKVWFVDLVRKRRKVEPESVPGLTDGRIYSGRQAVAFGLVDQIGDERSALRWLEKERNLAHGLTVIEWSPQEETTGLFGWMLHSLALQVGISSEKISALAAAITSRLKLDGMVSLWHPAGS